MYGELNVLEAFRKALTTWARWVDANINPKKSIVFFRGYSDSHFRYAEIALLLFSLCGRVHARALFSCDHYQSSCENCCSNDLGLSIYGTIVFSQATEQSIHELIRIIAE